MSVMLQTKHIAYDLIAMLEPYTCILKIHVTVIGCSKKT